MKRTEEIKIIMKHIDEKACSIPGYLEEDYEEAISLALAEIERKKSPRTDQRLGTQK